MWNFVLWIQLERRAADMSEWVTGKKMWGVSREPATEGWKITSTCQSSAKVRIKWNCWKAEPSLQNSVLGYWGYLGMVWDMKFPISGQGGFFSTYLKLKALTDDLRVINIEPTFKTDGRAVMLTGPSPSNEFYASIYKKSWMKERTCS